MLFRSVSKGENSRAEGEGAHVPWKRSYLLNRFFYLFLNVKLHLPGSLTMFLLSVQAERLERSPEDEDYTLNFEESVISSHTATDDEIDFRMILPSESHRRRSLGRTGRSSSVGSDQGTVSYSSVSLCLCLPADRSLTFK